MIITTGPGLERLKRLPCFSSMLFVIFFISSTNILVEGEMEAGGED